MPYITPGKIEKGSGSAQSKSLEIVIIETKDILTEPSRDSGNISMTSNYVLAADAYWTKLQVTNSKTSLPLTSEGEEDNISVSALPEFSYPGSTLAIEEYIANNTNKSIILGVKIGGCGGGASYYKMYGSKCAPLTLIVEGTSNNDATMYLLKFQQFAKTAILPGRYTGTFTFDTATTVAADATTVDVVGGSGEYQLTDNTAATVITDLVNASVGQVYTLLGSGGTNPATIENSNTTFILIGGVDWQGLSAKTLTVQALDAGGGNIRFLEKSRV